MTTTHPTNQDPRQVVSRSPLTLENIGGFAKGRLLDLHLASHSDKFVLVFDNEELLRAVSLPDLEATLRRPEFPRSHTRGGWKTTLCPQGYGWEELQRVRERVKGGAVMLVSYSPSTPFEAFDVTECVREFLGSISFEEVVGSVR